MKTKELVRFAIFLAAAVIASYVEHLIPIPLLFPGAKLGLANSLSLIILFCFSKKEYVVFGLLRVLLSALFSGFGTSFFISLGGNILSSIIVVSLTYSKKISVYGLSINGAIFHGLGQVLVVSIIYQTFAMINYMAILTISGIITGVIVAFIAKMILEKLPKSYFK